MAVSWDDQPRTRGDCVDGPRPCPWLSCRYHLGLPFEGKRRSANTCSLDVADQGGLVQAELADELGLSKARVQQIEATALLKFRLAVIQDDATRAEWVDHVPIGERAAYAFAARISALTSRIE
jgi:hypothetical protein